LPTYSSCLSKVLSHLKEVAKCRDMIDMECEGCPVINECRIVEGLFPEIFGELGDHDVTEYCRMMGLEIEEE